MACVLKGVCVSLASVCSKGKTPNLVSAKSLRVKPEISDFEYALFWVI